jgi:hypothetical protein
LTGFDLVAGLDLHFLDRAGHVRRHFNRRLVGLEFEDRLIDGDRVAGLDQDFQDIALGDAVAQVRDDEFAH